MAKRCRFLEAVVDALALPAEVHNARAEDLALKVDVVTARACAPLVRLLGFARPYLAKGARRPVPEGRGCRGRDRRSAQDLAFHVRLSAAACSDPRGRIAHGGGPGACPLRRTRVLAIANQKGGVGKTTTAINLGTALAAVGERVLLLDSDPQGNASTGLGVARAMRRRTLYDVLMDGLPVLEAVVKTALPGLDLLPADPDLSGIEVELGQTPRRSYRLRDALGPDPRPSTPTTTC